MSVPSTDGSSAGRPLVSVIIPARDAAAHIDDALDSVFAQEGPFALDVIVIDDGSTDDTGARARAREPQLRCMEQPNRGPAAARNAGLAQARGSYVAFLDSDDLWPPGKLARQLAVMEAEPALGLLVGDCRQFDESGPYSRTLFEERRVDAAWWGGPVRIVQPHARLVEGSFITTGAVVMRRSCVERVGRFDESLRLVEDLDYWLRVALACPMGHLDEVCLLRRRHAKNASRDAVAMSLTYLSMLERHRQSYGTSLATQDADIAARIAREYVDLGHQYARRGVHRAAASAYLTALRRRPRPRTLYYLGGALVAWAVGGARKG